MIVFRKANEFNRGILYRLLCKSYSEFLNLLPEYAEEFKSAWKAEDDNAFDFPDTFGECVLISELNNEPVGFISWDPRKIPEEGVIGQNCVVPDKQGKGYGKLQILKVLEIFRMSSAHVVKVSTADHPFFIPARKMYVECGFKESGFGYTEKFGGFRLINFEMNLIEK